MKKTAIITILVLIALLCAGMRTDSDDRGD